MIGWVTRNAHWILLAICLGLNGCSPTSENQADEQSDASFIAGRNRKNNLDFPGAIDAFEKALENNPRSASAHFELGLIYYQNVVDYAVAIYHFKKFLLFRPNDAHAETVQQFINVSIQELARSVSLGPVSIVVQKELNRFADDNWKLKQQVEQLQRALALATNHAAPSVGVHSPAPTSQSPSAVANVPAPTDQPASLRAPSASRTPPAVAKSTAPLSQTKPRTTEPAASTKSPAGKAHVVRSGESAEAIARRYGIRFSSLLVANPQLDPKRMKPGQTLKIPAS